MYINRRKTIVYTATAVLLFLIGYFHEQIDAMFINEKSLIGFLFIIILFMAFWIFNLKMEILKGKLNYERREGDMEELRHENWKQRNEILVLKKSKNKK